MSRIGKQPVVVPAGVKVGVGEGCISVEGPLGKLQWAHHDDVSVAYDETAKQIRIARENDSRQARAQHGLSRALIHNMVVGVTKGYEKKLEVGGVGYLTAVQKGGLQL